MIFVWRTAEPAYNFPAPGANWKDFRIMDSLPENIREWLTDAVADAQRRHLPQLKPLLETLALSTAVLRAADWNDTVNVRMPPGDELK
jgi:hypothetical protein